MDRSEEQVVPRKLSCSPTDKECMPLQVGFGRDNQARSSEKVPQEEEKRLPVVVVHSTNPLDGWGTNRAAKKAWKNALKMASTPVTERTSYRQPIAFTDKELYEGKLNFHIPLLVSATMGNHEISRIFIDRGSSVDIIFEDTLNTLKISLKDLIPYRGRGLAGFNGVTTMPSSHLELLVTYGNLEEEWDMFRTVKTPFLVLPCKSPFQCIVGRPTLGRLEAVTSTLHLKMKFYNLQGKVVTVPADIGAARQSHHLARNIDKQAPNTLQPGG